MIDNGLIEASEEESAWYTAMEEQADRDAEREIRQQRVNMRWTKDQVSLIRRAAAVYGIGYQAYIKQAAVRQALNDLKLAGDIAKAS
ncbi:MAG: hypothetical protein ACRDIY_13215 [Chloroflexota bacterium]